MDVERLATAQVEWVNALSGAQQLVSLRHALLYVLYKELQGQPPHGLLRKIGKSITEEPRSFQAWVGQTSNPDSVDIDQYPSITTREFLASLSEGEGSDAEVERARGQQQPTHTPRTPLRTTQRHAPSSARQTVAVPNLATESNDTDEDAAELELIEFIRDQRPHLLRTYLQ
ncbi:hypothetical protein PHYSODRAFT_306284 [Phytophthora sojae]|uniref:Uncharacterized protein n=1 Tax=Phytophthora sojae (strain P6497) TaxID=1094619 RepID=G5A8U5_PHYSP|nr:hypothetical protein PHYSODRAFT_306284 [Phytophthora sojae]EGZ08321.1 hypothetical protein PHYSODRAFT_306284 [Phytophthora sojae]|eukprot:XP_009536493.1 hypothetical protein PHYSODRAFT_306284 [Phytophthora sojae]